MILADVQRSTYQVVLTAKQAGKSGLISQLPQTGELQWWVLVSLIGLAGLLAVVLVGLWWRGRHAKEEY